MQFGQLAPRKAQTLPPAWAVQRPHKTGLAGGSTLLYFKKSVYPFYFFPTCSSDSLWINEFTVLAEGLFHQLKDAAAPRLLILPNNEGQQR